MTLISKLRKLNASMILYDKNNLHSDFFFMQYKIVYVNRICFLYKIQSFLKFNHFLYNVLLLFITFESVLLH